MRVPMSWLREYADIDAPGVAVAAALIRAGFEVEHVEAVGEDVRGVVVGEVLDVSRIEGSDKLSLVHVAIGDEQREIVCGASNFAAGDRVPVAVPGAVLPGGFEIGRRKVFGHVSDGMLCSARELGLGEDHSGILVLDQSTELGADAAEVLGLRDVVLDIAVTPDRGYGFSVRGIAREVAIAFDAAFTDPGLPGAPVGGSAGWPVDVADPSGCPRYVARVIRGLNPLASSPPWLRRRVGLTGMRPISLAVDVTNYVLMGLGQPLHAFDLASLDGSILVRRAAAGERLTTLDGVERKLDPADLLIADTAGPLVLAGILGGARAEVSTRTTDVLIEAAHFDPVSIGRSSRRHQLSSEAAKRFERGVDPELPPAAADLAVSLLVRLGGGQPEAGVTDVDTRAPRPVINIDPGLPSRVAGTPYAEDTVRRRLTAIGCDVSGTSPFSVAPASWRPDLAEAIDLVEEVIRLEGYDAVPSVLPRARAGRGLTSEQRLRRRVGREVASAGYIEVTSYPWLDPSVLDAFGLPADDPWRRTLRLANPASEQAPMLRTALLPSLLDTLVRNVHRGERDVGLYESGPVFLTTSDLPPAPHVPVTDRPDAATLRTLDAALPDQPTHLAAVVAGAIERPGWWGPGRAAEWADVVELARRVLAALHVTDASIGGAVRAPWHPGRCAAIVVADTEVGWAGELHPRVVDALGLPARTCAMELDLSALLAHAADEFAAPTLSSYPPAAVDVALVVAAEVPASTVADALRDGAGELLEGVRLFDIYVGPQVGADQRSLAFTLRFRAPDRTLTDAEVNAARDAAVTEAVRRTGAVLRG